MVGATGLNYSGIVAGQQGQGQKDDEPCWAGGLGTLGPGWRKSTSICALGGAAELEESMARLRGCAELIINTRALVHTNVTSARSRIDYSIPRIKLSSTSMNSTG